MSVGRSRVPAPPAGCQSVARQREGDGDSLSHPHQPPRNWWSTARQRSITTGIPAASSRSRRRRRPGCRPASRPAAAGRRADRRAAPARTPTGERRPRCRSGPRRRPRPQVRLHRLAQNGGTGRADRNDRVACALEIAATPWLGRSGLGLSPTTAMRREVRRISADAAPVTRHRRPRADARRWGGRRAVAGPPPCRAPLGRWRRRRRPMPTQGGGPPPAPPTPASPGRPA